MESSSDQLPKVGLGTSKLNDVEVILQALKLGYRHIDTGSFYGNHGVIKTVLEKVSKEIPRSDIVITTKLWLDEQRDIPGACSRALNELGVDYIDYYLMHWPYATKTDHTDFDFISRQQVWSEMEKLVDNGQVRKIGVSNYTVALTIDLMAFARHRPAVNQYETHIYGPRKALTRLCQRFGIQPVAYAPIGGRSSPAGQPSLREHPVLVKIGQKYDATATQVSIAWQLQRGVCVIPKSQNAERLQQNLEAQRIQLDNSDLEEIAKLDHNFQIYSDMTHFKEFEYPYIFE